MPPSTGLTRELIVERALLIIENDGIDALNMRRLAAELDSKPMTLYHYVPNKDALLRLILTEVAQRIDWAHPTGSPRDRMLAVALDMHERLAAVPWVIPILRDRVFIGVSALTVADNFLAAAFEAGLSKHRGVGLWRSAWDLVASDLQWREDAAHWDRNDSPWYLTIDLSAVADYPTIAALLPEWPELAGGFDIGEQLAALIDGTLATLSPNTP